ncbi:hypothetical protein TraAM80_04750 [Trypanosoma rangeli]|uniref:THUMP domain-containing protein n=1 Tax=Trypanosoma rangeli TaxID=5698 RepID=A0A3R7NE95_TRYRA|nr:uncharacterized protein TraAM80_04750 [Trypanosoma rangeli]RNF05178.1 hypothetical protein TraAM80_04750 [Trypanosoma rangeli]|eukprot:RNF05178.1 hypothetical protein TraAM80_04750 [Trypanosoma rangeli]
MPANATYRQGAGRQRHHKHRLGRMLVPHGRVSGLLFTVNPRQESKALRELQLYLQPLIADLEEAQRKAEEKADAKEEDRTGAPADPTQRKEEPDSPQRGADAAAPVPPSTSSLLEAELAEYVKAGAGGRREDRRRSRAEDASGATTNDDDESNADAGRPPAGKRRRHDAEATQQTAPNYPRWLAQLETGCKGHLMVSIPFPAEECKTAAVEKENEPATVGAQIWTEGAAETTAPPPASTEEAERHGQGAPPHSILYNPLVRTIVERIFDDIEENPRPLLRNCFRLMPCELTCCPTLPEMRAGLERLVEAHFPHTEDPRRLHRVGLSFKVKNNTGVENKKAYFRAALEAVLPANRFVVIPAARSKNYDGGVGAMFCVLVAHATCAMGVQRRFSERGEFNLHALGAKHLELSSSV